MKSKQMPEPPKFDVAAVIVEGDSVAAHGNLTMKGQDGETVPHAYCDLYRFRDAKIIALTSFVVKTEAKPEIGSKI